MTNHMWAGHGYGGLTPTQRQLHDDVQRVGREHGRDMRDVLVEADATPEDKAAVAEVYGGPGAGAEFLNGTAR